MNNRKKTWLKLIITCLLVIIIVWALGPFLAIDGKIFLASTLMRLMATLVVMIIGAAWAIVLLIKNPADDRLRFDQLRMAVTQLQQRIKIAFAAIKNKKQPWILLLGHQDAGKTTLLAHCGLTLHSPHQQTLSIVKNTQNVDWWLNEQAVFVDPAGEYVSFKNFWPYFLDTLVKKRGKSAFDGVVLVIDAVTLTWSDNDFNQFIETLSEQCRLLASHTQAPPLTLIVTQCDRLSGFLEFFSDLSAEERHQPLGFSLLSNPANLSIHELWQERTHAFLQQLSHHLIWRLHHEQNQLRRARIKDFPWQIEQLNQKLEKLLTQLPWDFSLQCQGVYYTSSVQSGNTINALTQSISGALNLVDVKTLSPHTTRQKSYFIQDLFQQLIKNRPQKTIKSISPGWQRQLSYLFAALIVMSGLFLWHQAYEKNKAALNIIQANISASPNEAPWLSQLDTLQQTLNGLNQYGTLRDRWLGFGQVVKLRNQMQTTYQQLLKANFVPFLDQQLTKQIQNDIDNNQPGLYNSLQVYLLLIQPERLGSTDIIHWFTQLWSTQYAGNVLAQKQLRQHLINLLQIPRKSWPTNDALIKQAQQVLQQRPITQTAFMMLQNLYQQPDQPLLPHQALPGFDLSHATISALYDTDNFSEVYNHQIPQIATQIAHGNWVIGKPDGDNASIDTLTQKIRTLYLQNYVTAWQTALNQIQLIPPKQFTDAEKDINILTDEHSALWQVLKKALANPVLQQHLNNPDLNANGLSDLIALVHQNDAYVSMQKNLTVLTQYINHLSHSAELPKTAYEIAAKRMQAEGQEDDPLSNTLQLAQRLPGPVNQWLQTLTDSVWQTLLDNSRIYINTIWTDQVLPVYQDEIVNRYPIFKDSDKDISLTHFNDFFGPGGTVEKFFNDYLKGFVNTKQVYWTWKKLDGKSLAIPQEDLDMLIRASMIQKMFYTDNPDAPSVRFTLTPISISPNITRFVINIGGQMVDYELGIKRTFHVTWPGNDGAFITLRFMTLNPKHPTTTLDGFWSWFHLLDQSQLQTTTDPKVFQVTFSLDGNQVVYQLVADNRINPYQPQLLASFRCPDSL